MGKVINMQQAAKSMKAKSKKQQLPTANNKKPVQTIELKYLDQLDELAEKAKTIAQEYDLSPKDVLTDALCALIESAILESCQDPEPVV